MMSKPKKNNVVNFPSVTNETEREVEGGGNMLVAKWINAPKSWSKFPRQSVCFVS